MGGPRHPDLDEVRQDVFGYAFVLVNRLGPRSDEALAPLGLTTRQWLLLAVMERFFPDHDPSLSEAAARYGTSRQNIKAISLQLVERGFLRLEPDPRNRSTTRLVRTELMGLLAAPAERQRAKATLAALTSGLTADELRALRRLLKRWAELLDGSS